MEHCGWTEGAIQREGKTRWDVIPHVAEGEVGMNPTVSSQMHSRSPGSGKKQWGHRGDREGTVVYPGAGTLKGHGCN